jgi:hypothetical protein
MMVCDETLHHLLGGTSKQTKTMNIAGAPARSKLKFISLNQFMTGMSILVT